MKIIERPFLIYIKSKIISDPFIVFLRFLKDENIYFLFIKNIRTKKLYLTMRSEYPENYIINAFVWCRTKEGGDFWVKQDIKWKKCIDKYAFKV